MLLVIISAAAFLPMSPEKENHATFLLVMFSLIVVVVFAFTLVALRSVLRNGIFGDFETQEVGSLTSEQLCARWLNSSELLVKLGAATCEPMVRTMNRYDKEALFNSLIVWESAYTNFLPASQAKKIFQEPGKETSHSRLVHMINSSDPVGRETCADLSAQVSDLMKRIESGNSKKAGQHVHQENDNKLQDTLPVMATPNGAKSNIRGEKVTKVVASIATDFMVDQTHWEHNHGPYTPRLMPVSRPHTPRSATPPHTPR